jgi:hypothetical protein
LKNISKVSVCVKNITASTHVIRLDILTEMGDDSEILPGGAHEFTLENYSEGRRVFNLNWMPQSVLLSLEVSRARHHLLWLRSKPLFFYRRYIPRFSTVTCYRITQIHSESGLNTMLYLLRYSPRPFRQNPLGGVQRYHLSREE